MPAKDIYQDAVRNERPQESHPRKEKNKMTVNRLKLLGIR